MTDSFLLDSAQLAEGQFKEACIPGPSGPMVVVLTRQAGEVKAWHNVCPHQGRSLNFAPDRFLTDDHGQLVCAHHGATFDRFSGQCVNGPCQGGALTPVAVFEQAEQIWLQATPPD
jgi:nitrite reductase/ring-hydroxylating ferredoxin subunit